MRDLASGTVLVVIAFVCFFSGRGLPAGRGEPGPGFFPFVLAAVLFALAVIIIIRGLKEKQAVSGALVRPVGLIALTVGYAVALTPLGFVVSTLGYTAGVVLLLGERGVLVLVIPAVTTAFIYGGFVVGLGVALP